MKRHLLLTIAAAALLMLAVVVTPAGAATRPQVLVINSYHHGLRWTDGIVSGIESTLSPVADLTIEYMDTKRHADARYLDLLEQLFRHKYVETAFDVIIVSDDYAFSFIRDEGRRIFGDTPVVFCGVNYFSPDMLTAMSHITGVVEAYDAYSTLSAALALHPGTREVVIINDRTKTGLANRKRLDSIIDKIDPAVTIYYLDALSMKGLQQSLEALPKDAIVLLMSFNQDAEGQVFSYLDSIRQIAPHCPVPMYGVWDFYLGEGIVGGMLTSSVQQGRTAAELALRIIGGTPPSALPVVTDSPNRWMFEYKQMRRFDITPDQLPAGSRIIHLPETFWTRNKPIILGTLAVMLALFGIIAALTANVIRRRTAEASLRHSEDILRATLESTSDGVLVVNADGRVDHTNTRFAEIWAIGPEMLAPGREDVLLDHIRGRLVDPESFTRGINAIYGDDKRSVDNLELTDGRIIEQLSFPLRSEGPAHGRVWFYRDITRRRLDNEALRKREEQFRLFIKHTPAAVAMCDTRMRYLAYSRRWVADYHLPDHDLSGLCHYDVFETIPEHWRDQHQRCFQGEIIRNEAEPFQRVDGSLDWVRRQLHPWRDDEGNIGGLIMFTEVITDTITQKQALTTSEERLKRAQAVAHVGNWEMDLATRTITASEEAFRIHGIPPGKKQVHSDDVLAMVPKEDRKRIERAFGALIRDNVHYDIEFRIHIPAVDEPRWVHSIGELLKDPQGRPMRLIGTIQDITDRKRAEEEKERLQEQLLQAQKMEAVGTLAGGIAHDFNNSLQAIAGYAQLLRIDKPSGHPDADRLDKIVRATRQASELIQQMLTFSRRVKSDLRPTDANDIVQHARRLLERIIPRMVKIDVALADQPLIIDADPGQLEQVIMNLAVNAIHAMPDGGRLSFETRNISVETALTGRKTMIAPGRYLMLSVSDTGVGMDKSVQERIFEPFFTTKDTGMGTGLGLAMVYGIVKSHGGEIHCYSEPGAGTRFSLYFPASETAGAGTRHPSADIDPAEIPGGTETILLVDDEDHNLEIGRDMLTHFGYKVITADSGESALEICRKDNPGIDLVILDINMPGMGGRQCLDQLREAHPGLRIVLTSGYTPGDARQQAVERGAVDFIGKPYQITALLGTVRRALDPPSPEQGKN